ncbi:MAG: PEP-CTERM sorting domain-containing protein [Opitutales bacterium]|nr:PEP-CTERM sorting domain-containing protein [Opitutales bacterium]
MTKSITQKTILLTGLGLLIAANTAYAEVHDILTWGDGNVSGAQKLEISGFTSDQFWKTNKTGLNIQLSINGVTGINTLPLTVNSFSNADWSNNAALEALYSASGKSSSDDFNGLKTGLFVGGKNGQAANGIKIEFGGFEIGKNYKVVLLVKSRGDTLNIRTRGAHGGADDDSTNGSHGLDIACQYGDMGIQDWRTPSGASWDGVALSANRQILVSFDITPTNASNALVLYFDNVDASQTTGVPESAIGMIAISAIPEPSAFSCLAGLGALCLAGSRRRKRA